MKSANNRTLVLMELAKGSIGFTSEFGVVLAQAGAVCFEDQNHVSGVELAVEGTFKQKYDVFWPTVTEQMRRNLNDSEEATEYGAYGVAILIAKDLTGLVVLERSRRGTGFDFWLGDDNEGLPFQNKSRLEVSGIRNGDLGDVRARVKQKLEQVKPTDKSGLPAYVAVVEFSAPLSQVQKK